jgi:hypothetical protein
MNSGFVRQSSDKQFEKSGKLMLSSSERVFSHFSQYKAKRAMIAS